MAYTQTQLDQVEAAIIEVAAGAEEVEINGKRFKKPKLSTLMSLRDAMASEVQSGTDGGIVKVTFQPKENL